MIPALFIFDFQAELSRFTNITYLFNILYFCPFKLIKMIPNIAMANPIKNCKRSFSSDFINKCAKIAVKNGATDMITPTLEAMVKVKAMFSNR